MHSTAQHSTAQHSTAQHITAHHSAVMSGNLRRQYIFCFRGPSLERLFVEQYFSQMRVDRVIQKTNVVGWRFAFVSSPCSHKSAADWLQAIEEHNKQHPTLTITLASESSGIKIAEGAGKPLNTTEMYRFIIRPEPGCHLLEWNDLDSPWKKTDPQVKPHLCFNKSAD